MCLDRVFQRPFDEKCDVGYKVFLPSRNKYRVNLYYRSEAFITYISNKERLPRSSRTLPIGIWIKDYNSYTIESTFGGSYETGFHIYLRKPITKPNGFIYKVYFKNVVAFGVDSGIRTVVAKEMFICPQEWTD